MSINLNVSSSPIKKALWYITGMASLVLAYIGFITPGIPFSCFLVFSAYCFSKSSKKMHDWLYNHRWFGPFLTNWMEYKIFPTPMKYSMVIVMSSSVIILWLTTESLKAVLWSGGFMFLVACWAWTYPGSKKEWDKRNSKKA